MGFASSLRPKKWPYWSRPTVYPRLDSDVLHWLKSEDKSYHSRMNEILRKEMLAAMKR